MYNEFHQDRHGRQGRSTLYTDQTIFTFLMLKRIFSLCLRAEKRSSRHSLWRMNIQLCSPDYSGLSKRARTVTNGSVPVMC
ncbi:UNVERIFIED_CONTAM: transposase [Aeromonas hydrophila]